MEQYLRKKRLGSWLDGAALRLLIMLVGIGWFVYLWGTGLPALLAGLALGMLGQMLLTRWRQSTLNRREEALRRRLGAELMLEDMLLSPARQAHFQAALLLGEKYPLEMLRVTDEGMLCRSGEETLLITCLRMPSESELSAGDLAACQRACREQDAARGVICPLGKVNAKILARAEMGRIPLRIIRREELLSLAGQCSPATDEQLVALGQRRRRPDNASSAMQVILRREKAGRYMLYGVTLMTLYIITGVRFYPVPGALCMTLAALCRCTRAQRGLL